MLRWVWRQLTSMRTALFLLLLLAVGAVPGSIWPQRNIDAGKVSDYLTQHRSLGPVLDRLGAFDVYSSPWFSAIYLLLTISLVGCVAPRSRLHWRAIHARPPRAPSRLDRLPEYRIVDLEATPTQVLDAARSALKRKRFRTHAHDVVSLSAENGYLRESGNLLFHTALLAVVVAVAVGHLYGWRGDVIVPEGTSFSNAVSEYGTLSLGPLVDTSRFEPFSLQVAAMSVSFEEVATGAQRGAPRDFTAQVLTRASPGDSQRTQTLQVNQPLSLGDTKVYLLGNGYAPVITVRDRSGTIVYREATPFLAQDNNYRSTGAVKVSGMPAGRQLGFTGFFLPTAFFDPQAGPVSVFPALNNPALVLTTYEGELYPGGRPQNVYRLSTDKMTQLTDGKGQPLRLVLTPGATITLPGDRGSITLEQIKRFAGISVRHDPGKPLALAGSLAALAGLLLSLTIRRRRVFIRVEPALAYSQPHTTLTCGALAKSDDPGLTALLDDIVAELTNRFRSPA